MTASERLRELRAAMDTWEWEEGTELAAVLTALPLIADGITALEDAVRFYEQNAPPFYPLRLEAEKALAALEEHLDGPS